MSPLPILDCVHQGLDHVSDLLDRAGQPPVDIEDLVSRLKERYRELLVMEVTDPVGQSVLRKMRREYLMALVKAERELVESRRLARLVSSQRREIEILRRLL